MSVAVTSETGSAPPSRERVELILHQLDRLPSIGPIAVRVLALTSDDRSSARDLVELIEMDPALSAGVLRMVRRADLGVRGREMSVSRAVTLLGFNAVRSAVLCREFFDLFAASGRAGVDDLRGQLWLHSVAVACAADAVAEKLGQIEICGDAFVCGLLHDIGKVALDYSLPKSYARVVERVRTKRMCICDAEHEVFALDHTVAGKRLLSRWGLPEPIVECAWLHHHDPTAESSFIQSPNLLRVVQLADRIVRELELGFSGFRFLGDTQALAHAMGLSPGAIDELSEAVPGRLAPMLAALGLTGDAQDEVIGTARPANQELRQLCAELSGENRGLTGRVTLFEAVRNFVARSSPRDTIGDVCAAAAQAACEALPIDAACAFIYDSEKAFVYAGWFRPEGAVNFDVFAASEIAPTGRPHDPPAVATALTPALEPHEWVWRRCFESLPESRIWALPIFCGEGPDGAILLSSEEGRLNTLVGRADDWAVLARSVGGAAAAAWSRAQSERTAEELIDLNRRLRAAQNDLLRMRSISMVAEMAGGAAHELNNPLAVISARAQMELSRDENPDRRRAMEVIVSQATKAAQIVLDLMSFAKPDLPSPILQPLSQVLGAVYQHWQQELGGAARRLEVSSPAPEVTVYADAAQLIAALNEVIANGLEATEHDEGVVRINSPSPPSDERVRIVVEDNGIGMTPDVLEHAVDPFFSSRPAGRRRGLGLSTAYRLTEINGGRLWLESRPNLGTTVTIELPVRAPA